eukprot:8793390-Pyramimonas_sp.AAC.1
MHTQGGGGHPKNEHELSSVLLLPRTATLPRRVPVATPQDQNPRFPRPDPQRNRKRAKNSGRCGSLGWEGWPRR